MNKKNAPNDNFQYKEKIIKMIEQIQTQDYLFKIYHYTLAKYRREKQIQETED